MTSNNNNKYIKGSPEWQKRITNVVGQEVDHEFKKDQIKPDGTKVTADTETIKVNDVQQLFAEIKSQKETVENKLEELAKKKGYKGEALVLFKLIKDLEPKIKEWKTFPDWYNRAYERFLKGGADGYTAGQTGLTTTTNGWAKVLKAYFEQKYGQTNSTALTEVYDNNLYQGTFRLGNAGDYQVPFRITENEAVKLMARVVKELGKIKKKEFDDYVKGAGKSNLANGIWRPASEFTSANVITWMDNIRDRAKYLVDNTIKGTTIDDNGNQVEHPDQGKPANGHRLEYSFGDDYTKRDGSPVAANNFTYRELAQLFNLAKLFSDSSWVNHDSLKPALTEIKGETLILLPAEPTPIKSEKLKDFGIEGYIDDNGNSNFYATNYGTRLSDGSAYRPVEYSWDSQFTVKVEDNLLDWARLLNSFGNESQANEKNQQKLISSFTNDPIKQLMADLRSYDTTSSTAADKGGTGTDSTPNVGIFTVGTNHYSYHDFPEFYLDEEGRLESLKVNKEVVAEQIKTGRQELDQAEKDYQAARKQLFAKEKEVEQKIAAKITELRTELKDNFKVSETGTNDFTGDNRITLFEHRKFQQLVRDIRFLVNQDEAKPTGKTNEDQAYQASQAIVSKATEAWEQSGWDDIGWKEGDESANQKRTNEERIALIKENKDGQYDQRGLNWWHDSLVELEKLVKLSELQSKIKSALQAAIDQQTPEETIKDWQNNLKAIEVGLETAFTEAKIKQWKENKDGQAAFNTITAVNSLLKKVCLEKDGEVEKVNDDFLAFLKGQDAELISLEKLIEKKEPKEVILLIHQWEYNKLDDTKKAERHLKYAWSELGGQQQVDEYTLTDEDKKAGGNFEKFLYQCAIGKLNYSSLTKPTEQQDNPETPGEEKTGFLAHLGSNWHWYALGVVGSAGILVTIFWKGIKGWWNGPTEEAEVEGSNANSDHENDHDHDE